MLDQLVIGNMATNDDFGASVKSRAIKDPPKKKITKTVPFSNATYDFTKINGEIYWEQRELEYEFEMVASCYEELEEMKIAFSNFIMNVQEEEIHDPFIPDYHFVGTYESKEYDDDETGYKTTVKVKFMAYPYKIANSATVYKGVLGYTDGWIEIRVYNNSAHKVTPTITVSTIEESKETVWIAHLDDKGEEVGVYAMPVNSSITDDKFVLKPGMNILYAGNNFVDWCEDGIIFAFSFFEEVF